MTRLQSNQRKSRYSILFSWAFIALLGLLAFPFYSAAAYSASPDPASKSPHVDEAGQVMHGFTQIIQQKDKTSGMSEKKKHIVLFSMGITLVILVLTTAGLGLAMVLYRKPVFVAHMIFAGMSVTLALVHALAAIIWFFPF